MGTFSCYCLCLVFPFTFKIEIVTLVAIQKRWKRRQNKEWLMMNISSLTLEMTRVSLISDVGQPFSVVRCHDRITDQLSILQNWRLQNEDFKALSLACFLGEPHHFKQPCSKRMGGRVISLFRVKWNSNLTKIKESPSFKNDMCALSWP